VRNENEETRETEMASKNAGRGWRRAISRINGTDKRKAQGNPYLGVSSKQVWVVLMADGSKGAVHASSREEAIQQMEESYQKFGRTEKALSAEPANVERR
jgi:hypothetical protein